MNKIFIITGPVKSFKTTKLLEWVDKHENVLGVLQPVIGGKRYIKNLLDKSTRMLELNEKPPSNKIITVGNYKFNSEVLNWAQIELLKAARLNPDWLVIDEYGKLELNGTGLEPAISKILNERETRKSTSLILVVRDYLLQQFLKKFNLSESDYEIFDI